jgi:hypothetical protein
VRKNETDRGRTQKPLEIGSRHLLRVKKIRTRSLNVNYSKMTAVSLAAMRKLSLTGYSPKARKLLKLTGQWLNSLVFSSLAPLQGLSSSVQLQNPGDIPTSGMTIRDGAIAVGDEGCRSSSDRALDGILIRGAIGRSMETRCIGQTDAYRGDKGG